jgi:hypothetical protein
MMNIYNGVVAVDENGSATIELPEWFEALNRDFRYQLTPIGAPAPGLYISQKVSGNRFSIAGAAPNVEVSWQVTGVRHDRYANKNRIRVEEEKRSRRTEANTERRTRTDSARSGRSAWMRSRWRSRQTSRSSEDGREEGRAEELRQLRSHPRWLNAITGSEKLSTAPRK